MVNRTWPKAIRPYGKYGLRIRIQYESKTYQKTIPGSPTSRATLQAAIAERDRMMECIMVGIDPLTKQDETTGLRRNLFIEDAQEYLDLLKVEYATEVDYKNRLNKYWVPLFEGRYTSDISSNEIKQFLNTLSISEKSKSNLLIPLKGVFQHADIYPNPAKRVKLQKHQEKRVERFTPEQRHLILKELSGQSFLYFAIAFGTGIRPSGELLGLRWSDYDGKTIYVHQSVIRRRLKPSTKTKFARFVIVPNWLKPILDKYQKLAGKDATWIFPNANGEFHKDADRFNAEWKKVFEKKTIQSCGIAYRTPYACRHTRAAELLSQGVLPALAAKQLGHSVEMFLNRYSEVIDAYTNTDQMDLIEGKKPTEK